MIIKRPFKYFLSIILLTFIAAIFFFNNRAIMFNWRMEKDLSKFWNNKVSIKEVKNFEAYARRFKIVLSTPVNNKKYRYLNCYEEKINGLYFKNYQASSQGESRALFSFSTIILNGDIGSNESNYFTVIYGYNSDLQVESYESKITGKKSGIVSNIADNEYFIDAFEGNLQDIIRVSGKDGSDKRNVFCD
ncbi:MAG: hypothetical protein K0R54_3377 [Clostridiaceae bacterium]|jgi:hypothetical protein|nr:hypothetical protein [Clostridiaceae bacterium]